MKKNIFEVFKEMNEADINNGTGTLGICNSMTAADKVKGGCIVKIGAPEDVLYKLMKNEVFVVMLVIDKKTYAEKGGD